MSDVLMIKAKILINVDDINDIRGLEYTGKPDDDLTGKYVVRIFSNTPFIDIVCETLPEAQRTYRNINKSRHVVNINEMRYDKDNGV